ncbi:MAG: hypothetical protein ACREBE_12990 [bacterium]
MRRETLRGLRLMALVRENLELLLVVLISAGERDLAERFVGAIGSTLVEELGDDGAATAEAAGEATGFRERVPRVRALIRAELMKLGIHGPEDLARLLARRP